MWDQVPWPGIEPWPPALGAQSLSRWTTREDIVLRPAIPKFRVLLCPNASQVALVIKNLPANAGDTGDMGSIPGLGRYPGGGNGHLFQYSCLENSMDRGAWQATVYGITESDMAERLTLQHYYALMGGSTIDFENKKVNFDFNSVKVAFHHLSCTYLYSASYSFLKYWKSWNWT